MLTSDAETAAAHILGTTADLDGVRVCTVVPESLAAHVPLIHLARIGGTTAMPTWARGPLVDTTHMALSCWAGPDLADARHLARCAVAALIGARGRSLPGGSTLSRAVDLSGPAYLADPYAPAGIWRYLAEVALTIH